MGRPDAPPLSREAELLLRCARLELRAADRARLPRLLEEPLDWDGLVRMAARHGLRPLLYRHLNAIAPTAVPKTIFAQLWACHERTRRRNEAMTGELLGILQLLDSHAIAAIPYKGPALAASVYGDLALREFGDLDILLRPQDILAAKALLCAQGYLPDYPLTPSVEAAFLQSAAQHHLALRHPRRSVLVELHWKTDPDFPVERSGDNRWWAELRRVPLGSGEVRSFSDRELLLVLCLHGAKHHWDCLGWLVDVAELIRQRAGLDWGWILDKAASMGCERRVLLGLHLAQDLLDAPLPEVVGAHLARRPEIDALAARIHASLFTPGFVAMRPFEALRLNLSLYERTRQRLAHCVNTLWAPSLVEWTRWPLPRALFFLYPPLRIMRLSWKYLHR